MKTLPISAMSQTQTFPIHSGIRVSLELRKRGNLDSFESNEAGASDLYI